MSTGLIEEVEVTVADPDLVRAGRIITNAIGCKSSSLRGRFGWKFCVPWSLGAQLDLEHLVHF